MIPSIIHSIPASQLKYSASQLKDSENAFKAAIMDFSSKVIVVTGGASGIGKATVHKLLNLSATVYVIDMADQFPDKVGDKGKLWFYPNVDVGSREAVSKTFAAIHKRSPNLHGLVNCAGIAGPMMVDPKEEDNLNHYININTAGTWYACTEFFAVIDEADRANASIVNLSSIAGLYGVKLLHGYVASKHAVSGLTRSLALEWRAKGPRVNAIAPALVDTPMAGGLLGNEQKDRMAFFRVKRLISPDQIANVALFLLSSSSSVISGQVIQTDLPEKAETKSKI